MNFSFDNPSGGGNTTPCTSSTCRKKKKNNVLIPIVGSGGGFVLLLLAGAATLIFLKRKKKLGKDCISCYVLNFDHFAIYSQGRLGKLAYNNLVIIQRATSRRRQSNYKTRHSK